jgi:hypothetical protein
MAGEPQVGLKFDTMKPRPSLFPAEAILATSRVLTSGSTKYSDDNWKLVPGAKKRYLDALWRHLLAYQSGEKLDPETGENHLAHVMCNVSFLLWADETNYEFLPKESKCESPKKL